jgi:hypothetical protein
MMAKSIPGKIKPRRGDITNLSVYFFVFAVQDLTTKLSEPGFLGF